jgi:hypothetical protein
MAAVRQRCGTLECLCRLRLVTFRLNPVPVESCRSQYCEVCTFIPKPCLTHVLWRTCGTGGNRTLVQFTVMTLRVQTYETPCNYARGRPHDAIGRVGRYFGFRIPRTLSQWQIMQFAFLHLSPCLFLRFNFHLIVLCLLCERVIPQIYKNPPFLTGLDLNIKAS